MNITTNRLPINFRVTKDEMDLIRKYSERKSLPMATLCRFIVLEKIKEDS